MSASKSEPSPLVAAARRARELAVAPFSGFKVGAALETEDGMFVTGCNVENATYGLTICAERVAMFKALSEGHRHADTALRRLPADPLGVRRQPRDHPRQPRCRNRSVRPAGAAADAV